MLCSRLMEIKGHKVNHNYLTAVGLSFLIATGTALAMPKSPYTGMQTREIKALSDDDITQLQRGAGWGLALPAELNGMPGPAHVLELKDQLGLTPIQLEKIQALYDEMKRAAVPLGEQFIEVERQIDNSFASASMDENTLRKLLTASERLRAEVRFVHLSQHLKTAKVLNEQQVSRYNQLRGYASDPCRFVPEGHDPDMYRSHMGCD